MNQSKMMFCVALTMVCGLSAMHGGGGREDGQQGNRLHTAAWVLGGTAAAGVIGYGMYCAYNHVPDAAFVQQQERFIQPFQAIIGNEPSLNEVTLAQEQQVIDELCARFFKQSQGICPLYCASMQLADNLERLEDIYLRHAHAPQHDEVFVASVKKCAAYESLLLAVVIRSEDLQAEVAVRTYGDQATSIQKSAARAQLKYGVIQKIIDTVLHQAVLIFNR